MTTVQKKSRTVSGNILHLYEIKYRGWGRPDICGVWADCLVTATHALNSLKSYSENMQVINKHTIRNEIGTEYIHELTFSNAMETQNGTYLPVCLSGIHSDRIIPDVFRVTDILDSGILTGHTL